MFYYGHECQDWDSLSIKWQLRKDKHLYKSQLSINNSNYYLPSFKTFLPSNSTESFQDVVSNGNVLYLYNGLSSAEILNFFLPTQWAYYISNKKLWFGTWMWSKTIFLGFSILSKWLIQLLLLLFDGREGLFALCKESGI